MDKKLVRKIENLLIKFVKERLDGQVVELEDTIDVAKRLDKYTAVNVVWAKRENKTLDDIYEWLRSFAVSVKIPLSFIRKERTRKLNEIWTKRVREEVEGVIENFKEFITSATELQ